MVWILIFLGYGSLLKELGLISYNIRLLNFNFFFFSFVLSDL